MNRRTSIDDLAVLGSEAADEQLAFAAGGAPKVDLKLHRDPVNPPQIQYASYGAKCFDYYDAF